MLILRLLNRYSRISRGLFWVSWPLLWLLAPLFLRVRLVIQDEQGHVLLVQHSFGPYSWMLPGGGVKSNESPHDAMIRELYEELAIDVDKKDIQPLHRRPKSYTVSGLRFRVLIFKTVLTKQSFDANAKRSYEISDMKWFSKDSQEVRDALPGDISL